MPSNQSPGDRSPGGRHEDVRTDALDVLADALRWRLSGSRWAVVSAATTAMRSALDAGDAGALLGAVSELELAGPVRAVSANDVTSTEAPEPVRRQIEELVRTMQVDPTDR